VSVPDVGSRTWARASGRSPTQSTSPVQSLRLLSFLQTPACGPVTTQWGSESLGWYDGRRLVGAGLVQYPRVPGSRPSARTYAAV
jgi:hypothetical protein